MNYLDTWAANVINRPSASLKRAVDIEGLRDAHLGPRWEYAKVRMRVEPSEVLAVQFDLKNPSLELSSYLHAAILGLLDVALVAESSPLYNIRVTVFEAEVHEVDSSERAFRMAGRDAGHKLLKASREQALAPPPPNTEPYRIS